MSGRGCEGDSPDLEQDWTAGCCAGRCTARAGSWPARTGRGAESRSWAAGRSSSGTVGSNLQVVIPKSVRLKFKEI